MTAEEVQRYAAFVSKITDVIKSEPNQEGLHGCLIGIGVGQLVGRGVTEAEVRELFEQSLRAVMQAHAQLSKESS